MESDEARIRLEREAKALAIISHPNVTPIFETGYLGPFAYLTSDYCEARSLAEWTNELEATIPPEVAAAIVAVVADTLEHCHQRGICHRDLKPANILLLRSPLVDFKDPFEFATQSVRVIDFGLAKQDTDDRFLTADGTRVGTPAYMSPEQAAGTPVITPRSDIYSMGAILFELLVGSPPDLREDYYKTLHAVQFEPLNLSRHNTKKLPKDLLAICSKALDKEPRYRYQNAAVMSQDLRAWLSGVSVSVRPSGAFGQLVRWSRRHPAMAIGVPLSFFLLASGLLFTNSKWREAAFQKERANRQVQQLLSTSDFILHEYATQLESKQNLDPSQKKVLDQMILVQKQLLADGDVQDGASFDNVDTLLRLVKALRMIGENQQAIEYIELGLSELSAINSKAKIDKECANRLHDLLMERFLVFYMEGKLVQALDAVNEIDAFLDTAKGILDQGKYLTDRVYCLRHRALCQLQLENTELASAAYQSSLSLIHEHMLSVGNGLSFPLLLLTLKDLANLEARTGLSDNTAETMRELVVYAEERLAKQPANTSLLETLAQCQSELAMLQPSERIDEALHLSQLAVAHFNELHAQSQLQDYGGFALALRRMALLHGQVKQFQDALFTCDAAIDVVENMGESVNKSSEITLLWRIMANFHNNMEFNSPEFERCLVNSVEAGRDAIERWPDSQVCRLYLVESLLQLGKSIAQRDVDTGSELLKESLNLHRGLTIVPTNNSSVSNLAKEIAIAYFEINARSNRNEEALQLWDVFVSLEPDNQAYAHFVESYLRQFLKTEIVGDDEEFRAKIEAYLLDR
ncbi:MAG: serine/threonine-protein kinase [Pirellulaceae bacterium]